MLIGWGGGWRESLPGSSYLLWVSLLPMKHVGLSKLACTVSGSVRR